MDANKFIYYFILLVFYFFIMKVYYIKFNCANQIIKKVVAKFCLFRIKITSVEIDVLFLQFYYNTNS